MDMLEYKGHHAIVEYDADDNIWVGRVLGINDILGFHGSSVDELKNKFADCINDYLDLCKEIGKSLYK